MLSPEKKVNSAELVYQHLRKKIDTLELLPGTRLTETEIAEELSVSRTPIREALQRLQIEGQVQVVPRRGCFVRNIDIDLISKFYDARITLETRTIELACDYMADELLMTMIDQWSPDNLTDDYSNHSKSILTLEESFHVNVAKGSGNEILGRYLDDINNNIRVVRWRGFPDLKAIADTYEEHYELLLVIRRGDKRKAQELMKKHIEKSQKLSEETTLAQLSQHRKHNLLAINDE